jgi:hypothetical protein
MFCVLPTRPPPCSLNAGGGGVGVGGGGAVCFIGALQLQRAVGELQGRFEREMAVDVLGAVGTECARLGLGSISRG